MEEMWLVFGVCRDNEIIEGPPNTLTGPTQTPISTNNIPRTTNNVYALETNEVGMIVWGDGFSLSQRSRKLSDRALNTPLTTFLCDNHKSHTHQTVSNIGKDVFVVLTWFV